jgi:uncharacterized protein DUF4845
MNKQRGLTLTGLIITAGVLVFFALIGFKLMPSYIEYLTIQRILKDLGHSPDLRGGTVKDIQTAFDRRAVVDNITSIQGKDLEVTKLGDGFEINANWATRVPLFGNVSACLDFDAKN